MATSGVKRLGHICLGTPQLEQMILFYQHSCGCHVVHRFLNEDNDCYGVMLRVADSATFLELFLDERGSTGDSALFRHLSFQVEEIDQQRRLIEEGGAQVTVVRGRTDQILQFWCRDPDGNQVEFTQFDEQAVYGEREYG